MNEQEWMLTAILDCERTTLYAEPPQLTEDQRARLFAMKARRASHEPLQYIVGFTDFMGSRIRVDERVLIPRPETELLVEHLIEESCRHGGGELRILDIGTGSGNIAIALAKAINGARVLAIDRSAPALDAARENARRNDVAGRIDFVNVDMFEFLENFGEGRGAFDIIVSNPPYIPTALLSSLPEDVRREPMMALDGGEDGLKFYRSLVKSGRGFLKSGGYMACEIGDGQKEGLEEILRENGYTHFNFYNDYRGTPRFFGARV